MSKTCWQTVWTLVSLIWLYTVCLDLSVWSPRILESTPFEPPHNKTNKMACAPSEDSGQPWHPPSLIRVFDVCMKKAWTYSYPLSAQRRLWSDWADAQANLSLRWAHSHCVGFVMMQLIYISAWYQCNRSQVLFLGYRNRLSVLLQLWDGERRAGWLPSWTDGGDDPGQCHRNEWCW